MFPALVAGVAFAAIGIGALVPARDHVDRGGEPLHPQHLQGLHQADATPKQETQVSKIVVPAGEGGRAGLRLTMDKTVAINFQLLGGIWILQTSRHWWAACSPAGSTAGR
ncbi:hypothetical protein GCM10023238_20790 [Streptomyces heliomycini]